MDNTNTVVFTRRCRFGLFFLLSLSNLLTGQEEVLYFHQVTVAADNLTSQNYNYYILKDSEGFVWISSINGLNRFDGREAKPYLPVLNDRSSLADGNIQSAFFEDKDGSLWFNTVDAIHRYNRYTDAFQRFQLKGIGEEAQKEYQVLFLDTLSEDLWVRHLDELYVYPLSGKREQIFVGAYDFNLACKILKEENKDTLQLYLPGFTGLRVVSFADKKETASIEYPLGIKNPKFRISAFHKESRERLYVGADTGLFVISLPGREKIQVKEFEGKPLPEVNGIAAVDKGRLVVATKNHGIYLFDTKSLQFTAQVYTNESGKTRAFQPQIDKIYLDSDQTLWVSCPGKGVYYTNLKKKKFWTFLERFADSPEMQSHVRALAEDKRGRIWCLTRDGIVVLNAEGERLPGFENLQGEKAPFNKVEPFYIYADAKGRIWACTQAGLLVFTTANGQYQKVPEVVSGKEIAITFIRQMSNGRILASSSAHGMFEVQEIEGRFYLQQLPELPENAGQYTWIFEDHSKRVWLTKNVNKLLLFHWNGRQLERDAELSLKPMVTSLLNSTGPSLLWVATAMGLYKVAERDGGYVLERDTVFPIQTVNGLLQDDGGNLWASTNRGLVKYQPDEAAYRVYNESEGLQSLEFNFWSCLKTRDGKLAFGGVNGVNIFHPSEIEDITLEARPVITKILIGDEVPKGLKCAATGTSNISHIKKLILRYRQNTLSFFFAPLDNSGPSSNQFRYQMIGLDQKPVDNGTSGFVRYANLPSGNYRFVVETSNSDGVWSQHLAALELVIKPPFWKTPLFYLLVGLAVMLAGYRFYQFRIGQVKKKEEYLRKEAEFRQKEAEYKQLVAETKTAVLRLQMNPHFIFNSMNSISSYILQKDIDTANDYLHRFSRLMRMILKYAEEPEIAIADEIELLDHYLQTEAMRFHKKIEYAFEISEELDIEDTFIPTMLLQPFVENAIWHGLSPKEGGGMIRIGFHIEGESLLCSVEDNGVGRAKASKDKSKGKEHESKALSITERRLQFLEAEYGRPASLEIIDLYDANGDPSGTRVNVKLPLL